MKFVLKNLNFINNIDGNAKCNIKNMSEVINDNTIDKLAVVVVTYKRQELLENLFKSFERLNQCPWRIVVVDNEKSEKTRDMVQDLDDVLTRRWGSASVDDSGDSSRVVYAPQVAILGELAVLVLVLKKRMNLARSGSGLWTMMLKLFQNLLKVFQSGLKATM